MANENRFRVYEHWRPDRNEPFYVGRGVRKRPFAMKRRNPHHKAIQIKLARLGLEPEVRVIASDLSLGEANALEVGRIAFWRSQGINLTNRTLGGDGTPGLPAWNKLPVTCLTDGLIFNSLQECARHYDIRDSCLSQVCRGDQDRFTAKGRHFVYGVHALTEAERMGKIRMITDIRIQLRKQVVTPIAYGSVIDGRDVLGRRATGPMLNARPVICVGDGRVFPSASEAARVYGVPKSAVIELCLGRNGRRQVSGNVFRYLDNV